MSKDIQVFAVMMMFLITAIFGTVSYPYNAGSSITYIVVLAFTIVSWIMVVIGVVILVLSYIIKHNLV